MSRKYFDVVGRELTKTNELIVHEAIKRGVQIDILPEQQFKMSHENNSYLVKGGTVLLAYNSPFATMTMDMKEVTSRLFRRHGFNTPENAVFSNKDIDRAWNWAEPILPVVIKPYDGMMGNLVFVNIDNIDEFKKCFNKIAELHDEVLIEQFVEGDEYRFTFVNDEIVGIVNRIPANVVGDGKHTVKELIELKNKERISSGNPIHKQLQMDEETERVLEKHGYTYDDIPAKDEFIYLRDNSNVSTGGDAVEVTDLISDDIKEYIRQAMMSIPGLTACGTDVLINGDEVQIIEVNTFPMITLHHYPWKGEPRDVTSKIVDGMFPGTVKESK
ncbi:ATP-grasp domain-containing protein [Amphibacillus sp. MSJ-3]|uniref:ATP-grasp domain-containing protein n=1 Tax=Amphibacillus sp. MSJ-3 TaxID=2841505 RepID=UPI001C0EF76E|nr:ATP-grasp domain-containing protein [Amphibacillus sp. MSJ-3]MBU5594477.1 ATP-grasp domain-containing protein [Amphibacillus sp. MSJ-3]